MIIIVILFILLAIFIFSMGFVFIKYHNENEKNICLDCGHSLINNVHGPDQNDYIYYKETDEYIHSGHCTYCKECQKEINEELDEDSCGQQMIDDAIAKY
jgi:hypothetical protein